MLRQERKQASHDDMEPGAAILMHDATPMIMMILRRQRACGVATRGLPYSSRVTSLWRTTLALPRLPLSLPRMFSGTQHGTGAYRDRKGLLRRVLQDSSCR
jgi:hypothetical protein